MTIDGTEAPKLVYEWFDKINLKPESIWTANFIRAIGILLQSAILQERQECAGIARNFGRGARKEIGKQIANKILKAGGIEDE